MTWELYEVWSEFDGHEELVETTKSKKEALALAKKTINATRDLMNNVYNYSIVICSILIHKLF